MHYKTTESLLAFIKKSPTAFQATKVYRKRISASFGARTLDITAGWEIYRNKKSFGIDCIFDSKEGMSEVLHYCKPQRFSGF